MTLTPLDQMFREQLAELYPETNGVPPPPAGPHPLTQPLNARFLDGLTAMIAAMTPGPWLAPRAEDCDPYDNPGEMIVYYLDAPSLDELAICGAFESEDNKCNAVGIVALVNAAPELIRLARIGAAYLAEPFPGAVNEVAQCEALRELVNEHCSASGIGRSVPVPGVNPGAANEVAGYDPARHSEAIRTLLAKDDE